MPPESLSTDQASRQPGFAVLRRFLPLLWPRHDSGLKARVIGAFALVLVAKAVILIMPFAYKAVIDNMSEPGTAGDAADPAVMLAIALVVAYAGARFGGVLFDNLRNVVFEKVGQRAAQRLTENVFAHLHDLSLRFHLERKTGGVTKIIERGTKSIDTMLYFLLFNIAPTAIELIAVCIIFFVKFGGGLVAVTLGVVAVYIVFTRLVTRWRTQLRRNMVDLDTTAYSHAVDSLLNFETVKYFNAEAREAQRFSRAVSSWASAAVKSENSLAFLNVGQALLTNGMMAGAMGYTVWGWSQGMFTTGDVVLVNALLMQFFRPLDFLGTVYRTVQQGLIDMEAMFELLDTPSEIVDAQDARALAVPRGEIRFENVRFGYDADRPILNGIDLVVAPGSKLAIVGPSGAGKSTIARLLFRFYDVTGGRILVDGQDIAKARQETLRAAIGIVPQDTVLFNDTIGYNIAYGREGASEAEIREAAKGAAIHSFIESLSEGYATRVGERGLKLSGGEKQRVAVARALLKDPPILILDEATSALDSRTEAEIQATLERAEQGRTTIVIAHRLSTIVDADEIVVLDHGRIAERGSHAALLEQGGLYAEMWARQREERAAGSPARLGEADETA
ncbi:ABCB family ABC transporter ATP-binding protein/permease [Parasphingopyxis marina]|uniref:ABC transporter ATP-binding protein/permease n=1 Tax=Parasphingopyxis marina TaxID=2761622 RepID=A0A842HTE4_9SPHN|nr:ABC transporter ATP-binding protein/permease [Parasphingopyxis marina]MBC2776356.1 ABC transporter ATP-binding protein/permease [Parasphingopyxis marina]